MKQQTWKELLAIMAQQHASEQIDCLLSFLLTQEEKTDLINRYLITKELLNGNKTQREIAATLQVSIAKITRGSNAIKALSRAKRLSLQKLVGQSNV